MGKFRKIYATVLATLLCVGTSGIAAEPTLDITDISVEKGIILVETVNKAEIDTTFMLTVSKDAGATGADKYYAVYMENVAAGGTHIFRFEIPDDKKGVAGSGSYTVKLDNYEDERISRQFAYADNNERTAFFSLLQTEAGKVTAGTEPHTLLLPVFNAPENQDVLFSIEFDAATFAGKNLAVQQQTMNMLYQMNLGTMTAENFPQELTKAFGIGTYNHGEKEEGFLMFLSEYNGAAIDTALVNETIKAMQNTYASVNAFETDATIAYGLATIKAANSGIMANALATYANETGLCGEIIGNIAALNPVPERQAYDYIVLGTRNRELLSNQALAVLLEEAYQAAMESGNTPIGGGIGSGGGGGGAIGGKGNSTPVESGSASLGAGIGNGTAEERVEVTYLFGDLASNHWAYDSVKWLKNRGIVSGTDAGNFEPDRQVTREEFTKMIVLACGIQVDIQTADFNDMADGAWYLPYIGAAVDAGVAGGIGDNKFGIGMNITRQDMAVMAKRALDAGNVSLVKVKNYTAFGDETAFADYAKDAIQVLYEADVINGKGDNVFDPAGNATRAEAAKIIYEAFKGVANQ